MVEITKVDLEERDDEMMSMVAGQRCSVEQRGVTSLWHSACVSRGLAGGEGCE